MCLSLCFLPAVLDDGRVFGRLHEAGDWGGGAKGFSLSRMYSVVLRSRVFFS